MLFRSKKDRSLTTYNFETVHNIDEYSAETCDVRGSMRAWNMTVQWWLVVNVHRRFPVKPLRTVVTMLISAFWHGVHSGYYLSMLTVPFILVAEDAIKKKLRPIVVSYFYRIFWLVASNEFSFFFFSRAQRSSTSEWDSWKYNGSPTWYDCNIHLLTYLINNSFD